MGATLSSVDFFIADFKGFRVVSTNHKVTTLVELKSGLLVDAGLMRCSLIQSCKFER
jgi:hypothetical protein